MLADLTDDTQWTEMAGSSLAGTYVGRQQIIEHVFAVLAAERAVDELQAQLSAGSKLSTVDQISEAALPAARRTGSHTGENGGA